MESGQHKAHSKLEEESNFYQLWLKDGYVTNYVGETRKISRREMIVARGKKNSTFYMTIDSCGTKDLAT